MELLQVNITICRTRRSMCGRASLTHLESELEERFQATFYTEDIARYNPLPSYNIAPTHVLPVISMDDKKHFLPAAWGWNINSPVPFMINAQIEQINTKKMFAKYLDYHRCIIPMDGYYEWLKKDKQKIPYRIVCTDRSLFGVAGLVKEEKSKSGESELHFVVITRPAEPSIAWLHERMPLILTEEWEQKWLDGEFEEKWMEILSEQMAYNLKVYPVSSLVNSVKNNSTDLISPQSVDNYIQGDLF
ncbi:MAG TPA: SOS response-associated peptidase [Saprospiraceae bacterium]|nr:SOS response-associated peptidase [Saprospiraceae bacterium]